MFDSKNIITVTLTILYRYLDSLKFFLRERYIYIYIIYTHIIMIDSHCCMEEKQQKIMKQFFQLKINKILKIISLVL